MNSIGATRFRAWLAIGVALLSPIAACGCVRAQGNASEAIYTIEPRVLILVSLVAWGSAFAGFLVRRTHRDLGPTLMLAGGLILFTTLPAMVASWVRVSDDRVEWRRGLAVRVYKFADIESIEYEPFVTRSSPRGEYDVDLLLRLKSGESAHLRGDSANPLIRAAASEILRRSRLKGVPSSSRSRPTNGLPDNE